MEENETLAQELNTSGDDARVASSAAPLVQGGGGLVSERPHLLGTESRGVVRHRRIRRHRIRLEMAFDRVRERELVYSIYRCPGYDSSATELL